jgi:hypothetical protein
MNGTTGITLPDSSNTSYSGSCWRKRSGRDTSGSALPRKGTRQAVPASTAGNPGTHRINTCGFRRMGQLANASNAATYEPAHRKERRTICRAVAARAVAELRIHMGQ